MKDIKSLTLEQVKKEVEALGEKPFRAKQLYEWMHKKLACSFDEMTNLPKAFRGLLQERFFFAAPEMVRVQESADGTQKFLLGLSDGNVIESVWMRYAHGNSVCVSSQAGCSMGCSFCASTLDGLSRSLHASEMLDQVYATARFTGERVSHAVVMGIGEPLDNYDQLLRFITLLTDENGMHMSQRNVTVSTCGIVPNIYRLADEKLQITLALSLHAADDAKRRQLMPIAYKYSIQELVEACAYYFAKTGRRITWEYSLIEGVNDAREDAAKLAELAKPLGCHINLIPVNPVRERIYAPSGRDKALKFKNMLEKNKINVTIRREMGRDIDGACGQLRRRHAMEGAKTAPC